MSSDARSVLVDVRTTPEWAFVGVPDLSSLARQPYFIEWQMWPAMIVAADFADKLSAQLERDGTPKDAPIIFLCRSGARSLAAANALSELGWSRAYNLAGGFEGPLDAERHRGRSAGWKASGLPWTQS